MKFTEIYFQLKKRQFIQQNRIASLNLNSFSYQIILGTDEVLNVLSQISSSSAYTSSTFNLQANSYFLLACTKFTTNLLSIRFAIDVNEASSTISYLTRTWSTNVYTNNRHKGLRSLIKFGLIVGIMLNSLAINENLNGYILNEIMISIKKSIIINYNQKQVNQCILAILNILY